MRRFNWRKFRRKGRKKLLGKDEGLLRRSLGELKHEIKERGSIKEVSEEVLPEE
ncbi:MAG: hypothetical protein ABWW66_06700 [Archaeoglobaceae archaeon]